MNRIKIGTQVTAKVCPTKVTVSGTFQGYELQDKEDPTSVCGKVFYVKDGMQRLDFVYVDSIKVCDIEDERIRKELIDAFAAYDIESSWNGIPVSSVISWLENKKEQKPAELPKSEDYGIDGLYAAVDILQKTLGEVDGYQTDDGILEHKCAISAVKELYEQQLEVEKAAKHVYESWMGGTMDDVRRDMAELGKVLNARKEE